MPAWCENSCEGGRPICNLYNLTTNQQAIRDIAPVAAEDLEAIAEAGEQRFGREDVEPGGGQLDRERQAFEIAADRGDGRHLAFAKIEVPAHGQLFLVGQTRHQHGVSATLLSNAAVRAGEIAEAIVAAEERGSGVEVGAGIGTATGPPDSGPVGSVGASGAVQVAS